MAKSSSIGASSRQRGVRWALLFGALLPTLALASWWNNDWKFRKEIGFDMSPTGADVATSVQDVPVLVRLSLANFSYFNDTKPDGSDFRVVGGDDKTPLKFHFERYDPQNQLAFLWVRVPQLTGGGKAEKIFAYYGNSSAAAAADPAGSYDAAEALTLHFSESSGLPQDATAYKNNASESTATLNPAGYIGGDAKFAGKESVVVPASPSLRLLPEQGFTAAAWLRVDQPQQAVVFALSDAGKSIELALDGARLVARVAGGGAAASVAQPTDLVMGQWHHVAITAGTGKLTLYVDGTAVGSAPATLTEIGGQFSVGAVAGARFLTGEVDEVQVAKTVRGADWIKASARGQSADSSMVLFGADGQREGSSQGSYFVTIAKNLTLDGWVVIGICMAMLAIALVLMVVKALFLGRVERANRRFLADYRRLTDDPTVLDRGGDEGEDSEEFTAMASLTGGNGYAGSTLYRLYHQGVQEARKRVGGKAAGAARSSALSAQSVDAIRAAMDASMTRLQQSLTSQMVMLTIAISGGPFLGLLGTVIGVMITFAAIAQSGDVNVNAIAPGTAAALAATVAGLAVAIPSLFGYNWLNTRIKAISADNRVFIDEFVTRLAEQFRE